MPIDLGGRVVVRAYRRSDVPSLAHNANHASIAANLRDGFPHPYTEDHARAFLADRARRWPPWSYAIALDDQVIGGIGILPGEDVHRRSAELGYWVAVPFQGVGVATRAVRRFVPWAMETFGLLRVFATVFHPNRASVRVLEKAGFRYEGRLRASVSKGGRVLDSLLYARTRRRRRP
jgi:RimJ/RimL family protein N-acetyltransferase